MSGNRTKRWNHHESWYFTLAGSPFEEVNKEYNVHFICTSKVIGGIEMLPEIVDEMYLIDKYYFYNDIITF